MAFSISKLLFSVDDQIKLLKDLSELFYFGDSPQDIVEDFSTYGESTEKEIAKDLEEAIISGRGFISGFEGWLPKLTIHSLKVGQEAGDLSSAFKMAYENLEATQKSRSNFWGQMFVPNAIILGSVAVLMAVTKWVYPMMETMTPRRTWPELAKVSYDLGTHFINYISLYGLLVVLVPVLLGITLRNLTGPIRHALNSLPVFRQFSQIRSAEYLMSLSQLGKAGIGIDESIEMIAEDAIPYVKHHANTMNIKIGESSNQGNLGHLLDTGMLNKRIVSRLKRSNSSHITPDVIFARAADEHSQLFAKDSARSIAIFSNFAKFFGAILMMMVFGGVFLLIIGMSQNF